MLRVILRQTAKEFDITVEQMRSKSRKPNIVLARQVYCHIARNDFKNTYTSIGEAILKHHATIIYAIRCIDSLISIDQFDDNVRKRIVFESIKEIDQIESDADKGLNYYETYIIAIDLESGNLKRFNGPTIRAASRDSANRILKTQDKQYCQLI